MPVEDQLGWIPGFADRASESDGLGWMSTAGPGRQSQGWVLTGTHMSRATRSLQELGREQGGVLTDIVPGGKQWIERACLLIDWLKPSVYERRPLPQSLFDVPRAYPARVVGLARELAVQRPGLGRFVDALSWLCVTDPRRAAKALGWTEANSAALEPMLELTAADDGLLAALHLWVLADVEGPDSVAFLVRRLEERRVLTVPIDGTMHAVFLQRLLEQRKTREPRPTGLPPRPEIQLARHLFRWIQELVSGETRARQRALSLAKIAGSVGGIWIA
jgi:hypothetical protein